MKKFLSYILLTVAIVGLVAALAANAKSPEQYSEPEGAEYYDIEVSSVHISSGEPEVRSTSMLISSREDTGNSYGKFIDEDGDGMEFPSVKRIRLSYADKFNGPYVGIYVEDLSEEELSFFPKDVRKELPGPEGQDKYPTDGLIWISSKYVSYTVAK